MNDMKLITFDPLDTLFFREARPFNAGEGGFLNSQFPPSAQTLSGAIRTAIGEAKGIDWNDKVAIKNLLGTADDPAPLVFTGPYLFKEKQRLYPVPLNLLYSNLLQEKTNKPKCEWTRLIPSSTLYQTDMGQRKLPEPEKKIDGAKPIEDGWLDADNLQKVLKGGVPDSFIPSAQIFTPESRVGIGRDNKKGVVSEGLLYFTRHVRMHAEFTLGMAIGGETSKGESMVRLGGEGRLARVVEGAMPPTLTKPNVNDSAQGLFLMLLTHGDFDGKAEPVWDRVHSSLKFVTACIGKPVREGGWDYAKRKPKPLKSMVPAGSCYFIEVAKEKRADVIRQLHGKSIGQRTALGYG